MELPEVIEVPNKLGPEVMEAFGPGLLERGKKWEEK